jgi:hypothetical protein
MTGSVPFYLFCAGAVLLFVAVWLDGKYDWIFKTWPWWLPITFAAIVLVQMETFR